MSVLPNFINNEFKAVAGAKTVDVINPADGSVRE